MTVPLINLGPQFPSSTYIHGIPAEGGISVPLERNFSGMHALELAELMSLKGRGIESLSIF